MEGAMVQSLAEEVICTSARVSTEARGKSGASGGRGQRVRESRESGTGKDKRGWECKAVPTERAKKK